MFKELPLEYRNIQTQNCASIQRTVWARNDEFFHVITAPSIDLKKQSEHSGLRPDTSNFVGIFCRDHLVVE